jgi:hypothetical protein
MNLPGTDFVGSILGLTLTLSVFSYLLKDNALFRVAVNLFVGTVAGYVAVVAWSNVIWPQMILPLLNARSDLFQLAVLAIPLILSCMLLTKLSVRYSALGNPVMAFLVGVGAAAAIGGATLGTLYPQVFASIRVVEGVNSQFLSQDGRVRALNASVILISTMATLIYFQFKRQKESNSRYSWLTGLTLIGKVTLAVAFGVIFSGVYLAGLSAFVDRVHVNISFIVSLLQSILIR